MDDSPQRPPIHHVLVVAKLGPPEGRELAARVGEWLEAHGTRVTFETNTASAIGRPEGVSRAELPPGIDLAIVAGGDGTLLSVARAAAPLRIPILGVNLGSLGFLTELQPDEVFEGLRAVLDGRYVVDERQMLRVRPVREGRVLEEYALLNDAVIAKSALARMITIDVRIDGAPVARYTSDGLIVAPRMSAFVIAPICPHSMTHRPLVVPGSVTVEAVLHSDGEAVYLTLDGQIGFPMEAGDFLNIDAHPCPARLVRIADRSFFEVLRRKLRWGER
jgi:NAD+ kinase